jgi:VWFA-related protein
MASVDFEKATSHVPSPPWAAMVALCLTAWVVLGAADQAPSAQVTPQATLRAGVEVVQLDVLVLDKNRQPVRGLAAADFTILEDDKPQPVVAFAAVNLPDRDVSAASWVRDIAPDVVTNRLDEERVVVILLDDFHVSSDPSNVKYTKDIARAVVEQLGPADLAAVVYTFIESKGQDFTTDRSRLLAAVDRFESSSFSSAGGTFEGLNGIPSAVCFRGECVTAAFRNIAAALGGSPGRRKLVVYVSPQAKYNMGPQNLEQDAFVSNITGWDSVPDLVQTFTALQEAGVAIYQYDPRGVLPGGLDPMFGIFAENTGGRAVTNTNTPWERVPEMFRENSSYYMIGFQSTHPKTDGRFRRVTVRVARPAVEVRTRRGYYAPVPLKKSAPGSRPPTGAVDRALAGALPSGELQMSLTVAPFAVPGTRDAAVAIITGLDQSADLAARDEVELTAKAFNAVSDDRTSRRVATSRVALTPHPGASGTVHFDLASRLNLPPGRYEIRVAIDSPATGRTGSVYSSVTIPDFVKEPLTLSGVVLSRLPPPGAVANDPLGHIVPVIPTALREFAPTDRVTAFARIYQGGKAPTGPVRLTTRLVDEGGREVFGATTPLGADDFLDARAASYRFELPLARLAPGAYLLSLEATSGKTTIQRTVTLRVVP